MIFNPVISSGGGGRTVHRNYYRKREASGKYCLV